MISIEEYLHQEIKRHSGNIKTFCDKTSLPYMTVNNVIKRGIINSSLNTLQKICDGLDTSLPLFLLSYKVLTGTNITAQEVQGYLQASAISMQYYISHPSTNETDNLLVMSYFETLINVISNSDMATNTNIKNNLLTLQKRISVSLEKQNFYRHSD